MTVIDHKVESKGVVDDYLNSLLFDSQLTPTQDTGSEPALRFARIDPGYELISLWKTPANRFQALCMDLILLGLVQKLPHSRLRTAMLKSIRVIGCRS